MQISIKGAHSDIQFHFKILFSSFQAVRYRLEVHNMTSTTGAAVASALADNSADLAIDLMAGKAILSKLSAVLPSGDDKAIEDVLTNNGYHTTVEGVNAVLQTANPGPGFDIKMGESAVQTGCNGLAEQYLSSWIVQILSACQYD